MTFIKSISRKRLNHFFKNLDRKFFAMSFCLRSFNKFFSLCHKFCNNFLSNRTTKKICPSQRKSSKYLSNLENLLLINRNTKGGFQNRLQIFMRIFHPNFPMFSIDIIRNPFHWSRTIQRYHRNNILQITRFEFFEITTHSRGLQLKNTRRLSFGKKSKGLFFIKRNRIEINFFSMSLLNNF